MIDWNEVHHSHLEKFIYYTLSKVGFSNRQWFGRGGGDEGRDVVAYTYEEKPFNLGYHRKWIFQAKKWGKYPAPSIILNELALASQHSPDFWVLVIPLDLTASQIDFLERISHSYPFKILTLPLASIEEIIYEYPETKNILLYGSLSEGGLNNV